MAALVKKNERIDESNRHLLKRQEREKWLRELHGGIDLDGSYINKDRRIRGLAIIEKNKLGGEASTGVVNDKGERYLDNEIRVAAGTWSMDDMLARLNPEAKQTTQAKTTTTVAPTCAVQDQMAEVMRMLRSMK